jgi:membrane-bound inhibitor of C-type lysozyme
MAITLKHIAAACAFAFAAVATFAPACAATEKETHPKAVKVLKEQKAKEKAQARTSAKHKKARKEEAAPVVADEPEPDITDTVVAEYSCELNNKVTIYTNDKDDAHIALRWKNRLHRLDRVGTTTGALRFENPKFGLIWIGIPSKGILLDSKLNRQLANECKKPELPAAQMAAAPVEKKEG